MAWSASGRNPGGQRKPKLAWETLSGRFFSSVTVARAKVPGGWLIMTRSMLAYGISVTFYPDPEHAWDGGSLP